MSRALAPYTCDESPTSVYNRHHRAHFWRGLLAQFPGLIDFAAERLADPRLREAFFAHLVALERFLGTTTSDRGHAVCEQDRSSVLYYLLAAPEDARSELVGVLNAFESARGRDTRHSMRRSSRALISADDLYRLDAEAAAPPIKPTPRGQNRHDLETDMRARETDVIANLVRRFSSDDGDGDGDGPAAAATDGSAAAPRDAGGSRDGPPPPPDVASAPPPPPPDVAGGGAAGNDGSRGDDAYDAAAHGDAVLSVELAAVDMVTPADDDDTGACAAAGCVAPP